MFTQGSVARRDRTRRGQGLRVAPLPMTDYRLLAPRLMGNPGDPIDLATVAHIDLRQRFEGRPLELEIGYGYGRFLIERAHANPASAILGFEIKSKLAHQVGLDVAKAQLTNAFPFFENIVKIAPRFSPDAVFENVFLNFPDPWWKNRHHERRVIEPAFLEELARLMKPGARLAVQTDVVSRHEEMLEVIKASPAFKIVALAHREFGAESDREARCITDGLPIYRFAGERR